VPLGHSTDRGAPCADAPEGMFAHDAKKTTVVNKTSKDPCRATATFVRLSHDRLIDLSFRGTWISNLDIELNCSLLSNSNRQLRK
jgi:hypothetical protein